MSYPADGNWNLSWIRKNRSNISWLIVKTHNNTKLIWSSCDTLKNIWRRQETANLHNGRSSFHRPPFFLLLFFFFYPRQKLIEIASERTSNQRHFWLSIITCRHNQKKWQLQPIKKDKRDSIKKTPREAMAGTRERQARERKSAGTRGRMLHSVQMGAGPKNKSWPAADHWAMSYHVI